MVTCLDLDARRWCRVLIELDRLTWNIPRCMFPVEMSETKKEKPELGNLIKLRQRADGVVVFYADGQPRMGVREGPKTVAMFEAIEAAYAGAVSLEVTI